MSRAALVSGVVFRHCSKAVFALLIRVSVVVVGYVMPNFCPV